MLDFLKIPDKLNTMKAKIKVRKTWGELKPITKRIDSAKIYKRSKDKFSFASYSWGDLN